MVVEIDRKSGFCFGVQNAVEIAEKAFLTGKKSFRLDLLCIMTRRLNGLQSLGLVSIDHDEFRISRIAKFL